jgi:endo-1,3-1,4-beta-glycanase ExoK
MNSRKNARLAAYLTASLLAGLSAACDGGSTEPVAVGGMAATVGGATAQGGAIGTTAAGGTSADAGAPPANGNFVLAWEDNFDTFDSSLWALQTFTWDGNLAQFSATSATVADGILTMSLTSAATGATKPYLGAEVRSTKTITYGKVSARMRFASGSGVVSGLVLFYTPWPNCDWNEIDVEHLGRAPESSQLNAMVYTGTYNASCTTSVTPIQEPLMANLGFDAETDFHLYDIEWTPTDVKYYADGVLLRTWTTNIALLKRPMNVLLTIWASSSASWAGAVDATTAPSSAELDWIKVYEYK